MSKSPAREAAKLQAAERRRQCMALRVQGLSVGEIADELQLSKSTVHGHITRALTELAEADREGTARYRALNIQRLDALLRAAWPHATGTIEVRKVAVAKDGTTTTTTFSVIDTKALREARQLIVAQNRLLGLEAPIKVTHTDPTGEIARSPHDWVMPVPPERNPHEWAEETRAMLANREQAAERMVEELLGAASRGELPAG